MRYQVQKNEYDKFNIIDSWYMDEDRKHLAPIFLLCECWKEEVAERICSLLNTDEEGPIRQSGW